MVVYSTVTSYVLFILSCTTLQFRFVCSHSKIVSYISFILSCTMLQFIFVCNLFVLLFCSHKNTLRPCSTDAIGVSHRLLPPAAPSWANGEAPVPAARPQPSIRPHRPVPIWYTRPINPAKPAPPNHFWTNTPSDVSQSHIFHHITSPSKPFSNRHAKSCDPDPSFLIRLPAPPIHFRTDNPSAVSQSCIFHHITCPSKTFLDQRTKHCETLSSFLVKLPAPTRYFWTDTPSAVIQYHNFSSDYLPL